MKIKKILYGSFLIIIIIDIFLMSYKNVNKRIFSENDWKSNKYREEMLYDLIKNQKEKIKNEEIRNKYLGDRDSLGEDNWISMLEEYRYITKGYILSKNGILLKSKLYIIFYKRENDEYLLVKEYYILNKMIRVVYLNNIYDNLWKSII